MFCSVHPVSNEITFKHKTILNFVLTTKVWQTQYITNCIDNYVFTVPDAWNPFFLGMYAIMFDAFQPGVPVYARFDDTDTLIAHCLSIDGNNQAVDRVDRMNTMTLTNRMEKYFERVIR